MKTIFDPLAQRYPSARYPLYARGGMVNCSNPQASAAGLEILRRGGNAMDAAVAAAATLTVTEPTANGIGSDAFALVWSEKDRKLYGLNSSGPAPALASIDRVLSAAKCLPLAGRLLPFPAPRKRGLNWQAVLAVFLWKTIFLLLFDMHGKGIPVPRISP